MNQRLTPDVNSMTMQFYKRRGIIQKYSFSVTLDISQEYNRLSPLQQAQKLNEITASAELVHFVYRERDHQPRVYWVKALQERRVETTGAQSFQASSALELAEI